MVVLCLSIERGLIKMNLRHIDRGTKMFINEDYQQRAVSDAFEAVFRYLESDSVFIVQCAGLHEHFDRLESGSHLNISFIIDPNTYKFTGRAMEKQRSNNMVLIEQLTEIVTINPRKYDRDEIRFKVSIYGLPETKLKGANFERPVEEPEMSDVTYDVSAGGLCIVSNNLLSTKHDPYYLLEFSLSEWDNFLLPAKIVRRSTNPRTKTGGYGRYDYGFQFLFDKIPEEKGRLTKAILNKKLSQM